MKNVVREMIGSGGWRALRVSAALAFAATLSVAPQAFAEEASASSSAASVVATAESAAEGAAAGGAQQGAAESVASGQDAEGSAEAAADQSAAADVSDGAGLGADAGADAGSSSSADGGSVQAPEQDSGDSPAQAPEQTSDPVRKQAPAASSESSSEAQPEEPDVASAEATASSKAKKNGLVTEGGATYLYKSGVKVMGEQKVGSYWYRFDDATGKMIKGFYTVKATGKTYYYDDAGHRVEGQRQIGKSWYYFLPGSGVMQTGFSYVRDQDKWCYYDSKGRMVYGQQRLNGAWYYLDRNTGAVARGFVYLTDDKKWVFYDKITGRMCYGERYEDSPRGWVYLDDYTGAVTYGWKYLVGGRKWVYYDVVTGRMLHGTHAIGRHVFHLDRVTGAAPSSEWGNIDKGRFTTWDMGVTLDQMAKWQGVDKKLLDPASFYGTNRFYQFADLRKQSGLTAAQLNRYISHMDLGRKGVLLGHGQDILDAAKKYGISEVYLLAHMNLETGYGTSALARGDERPTNTFDGVKYPAGTYYNFVGYGAFDDDPFNGGMNYAQSHGWDSVRDAIFGAAEDISRTYINGPYGQPTLYEMRWAAKMSASKHTRFWHQYATDKQWATSNALLMGSIYDYLKVNPNINYIIPVYR